MHITNSRRYLLTQIVDVIAIKAGMVLSISELLEILNREKEIAEVDDKEWWEGDLNGFVRIEALMIEIPYILAMKHIGALADAMHPIQYLSQHVRKNPEIHNIDPNNKAEFVRYVSQLQYKLFQKEVVEKYKQLQKEYLRRHILNMEPISATWNGSISLRDLFRSEDVPENTTDGCYFDQRYIDYLSAQVELINQIHWRQFEYLTAEYFKRNGYTVEITPPRGDGGIDVYARKEDEVSGPVLIIIQCKRYSETNTVKIEDVKAFYTDMADKKATKGVIITTSHLGKNAREFCEARRYQLTSIEKENIINLIKGMATRQE